MKDSAFKLLKKVKACLRPKIILTNGNWFLKCTTLCKAKKPLLGRWNSADWKWPNFVKYYWPEKNYESIWIELKNKLKKNKKKKPEAL